MRKKPPSEASTSSSKGSFTDATCLQRVVAHLAILRTQKSMSLENVARKARVRKEIIRDAEQLAATPSARVFKAWAAALGTSWDQLWADSMLPARRQEVSHSQIHHSTTEGRSKRRPGTHVYFRM